MFKLFHQKAKWAALIVFALVLTGTMAYAQPNTPTDFQIRSANGMTFAQWFEANQGEDADGFHLWVAEGETTDLNDFSQHPEDDFVIRGGGPRVYFGEVFGLDAGTYSCYLTAYNSNGNSDPTSILNFEVANQPGYIRFLNHVGPDDDDAWVNQEWTFDVDAEYSGSEDVKFRLLRSPNGMTINESTGEISWTPTEASGKQYVILEAYIENTQIKNEMHFGVQVFSCQDIPKVIANISLEGNSRDIDMVLVNVHKVVGNTTEEYKQAVYRSDRITIDLDEGEFYIHFSVPGATGEWYNDAADMANATAINLSCGDSTVIDVELAMRSNSNVRITSTPVEEAYVGEAYTYQVQAEAADPNATIKYSLTRSPAGMTIDENTGEITWTPTESGNEMVSLQAYIDGSPETAVPQVYPIRVFECTNPAIVSGTVTDQNGNPVNEAMAMLYDADAIDSLNYSRSIAVAKITNGQYSMDVDAGDYILVFSGRGVQPEFWEDAQNPDNATVITVDCGDTFTADAVIEDPTAYVYHNVSGRVVDATTNQPISGAFVQMIGNTGGNGHAMYMGITDDNGAYEIRVPERFEYVARAFVFDSTMMQTGQYLTVYYNQKTDASEADILQVQSDLIDINFALPPRPTYNNVLNGEVVNEDNMALEDIYVVAILVETGPWGEDQLFMGRTATTDQNGDFQMNNLIPGDYILLGFPRDRERAMPGYYVENDVATRSWLDASRIVMEQNTVITDVSFKLPNMSRFDRQGIIGIIRGFISRRGGSIKMGDKPQSYEAIAGAVVYAIDENGKVVASQTTNTEGGFELDNLAKGKYTVEADKVGFEPYANIIELESDEDVVDTDITLQPQSVGVEDEIAAGVQFVAYPNPTSHKLNLSFEAQTGNAKIAIVNSLGENVYSVRKTTGSGMNTFTIDVSNIPTGSYYVELQTGTNTFVAPVIIER